MFPNTSEEVKHAICELKSCKAPGLDSIAVEIIKISAPIIIPVLRKVFNHILNTGTYPKLWGEGIITSIHKKGSKLAQYQLV